MNTLKDYTVELLKSGKSDQEILSLLQRYIDEEKAQGLLAYAKEVFADEIKKQEQQSQKQHGSQSRNIIQIKRSAFLFGLVILFFVFTTLLVALIVENHTPKVMNDNTFFELADACKKARYEKVFDSATIVFTSYENCTLEKRLIDLSKSESLFARDLFINTSMTCQYIKYHLDPTWITKMSGGILDENCKGSFKDAYLTFFVMQQLIATS